MLLSETTLVIQEDDPWQLGLQWCISLRFERVHVIKDFDSPWVAHHELGKLYFLDLVKVRRRQYFLPALPRVLESRVPQV